ncbi:pupal cuticle protein 20 [Drosophila sulfurigaster albostrigata]|uniref:pupal cuticle protein 20 n=1 Tax=Drosophila sulfurigaster albostrigata TaxID=89887 RepID=UPI002D2183D2|nr:pupal cuticle protein 20 [Drosophila sulfurigaster albostrigata]
MLHQRVVLASCLLLASFLVAVSGGRLPQRYLPSNQYLAPQASHNQLHYHGVSGGQAAHSRIGGIAGGASAYAGQHGAAAHRQTPQIPIVRSDYQSDANGNYNFGFDTGNGIHRDETGEFKGGWPHGSLGVRGSYSYTGDDGQQYTVNYKADKNGFHAEGAHLPTSPSLPADPHQHRSAAAAGGYHGNAYHGAASSPASSSRYLPPGYRQRRHY